MELRDFYVEMDERDIGPQTELMVRLPNGRELTVVGVETRPYDDKPDEVYSVLLVVS